LIYTLSLLSGIILSHLFAYFPCITALLSAAGLVTLSVRRRFIPLALVLIGAVYPFLYNAIQNVPEQGSGTRVLSGHFSSPAVRLTGGFSQDFIAESEAGGKSMTVLSGKKFEVGREHEISVRVQVPWKRLNPGSREREPYAVLMGVRGEGGMVGSLRVRVNRMRERLNDFLRENLGPDAAGLVMAVTTGNRSGLGHELRNAFRTSGLAHLLSISGTHFGLFAMLVYGFFRLLIRYLPVPVLERFTVYLTPFEGAAILTLPFMLLYLGISGGSIPSVRAFIMVGLFLLGLFVGRSGYWLNFLLLAAVVILLWDPEALLSLSFQLSFTAVLFIGFFIKEAVGGQGRFSQGRPLDEAGDLKTGRARVRALIVKVLLFPLLVSLAATVGLAPLIAYYFHYSSTISPAANLVVTPIVGFMLVPMSLIGCFLYLLTGSTLMAPLMDAVSGVSIHLVRAFASVPYCSVRIPPFPAILLVTYYAGFALYWAVRKRRFLKYSLAISFLPMVLYLAVSDTSVIELPDGKVIVLDTGRSGKEVEGYLRHRGIKVIDALVLTHAHRDHLGGARRLLERFEVKEFWDSGRLMYPEGFIWKGIMRRRLSRGDYVSGDGYRITVLHPYPGFYSYSTKRMSSENNDSLVFRLDVGGGSVIFTGDIETGAIEDILHFGPEGGGGLLRSDIIKIPHHGLRSSHSSAFIGRVSPEYAVVSSDRLSPFLRDALRGRRPLLTGSEGAVKVALGGDGFSIKTAKDFMLKGAEGIGDEVGNLKRLFSVW
jgi:competence protein ComEC